MRNYKKREVYNLAERMLAAGATNESLAEAACVSTSFINKARKGIPVCIFEAALIDTALHTKKFKRKGRHPHIWPEKKRLDYESKKMVR